MASGRRRGTIRDISALARRIHQRFAEYPRRHRGQGVLIDPNLSRILELAPRYQPHRPRAENKQRQPPQNPGIFTIQAIAETLDTTVGDLLGEPGYVSARDLLPEAERRKLRQAMLLLRELFDLDDESLDPPELPEPRNTYRFVVPPEEFIELDHDYPRALHAWVVSDLAAAGAEPEVSLSTTQVLHSVREVWDARLQVLRVLGDSMAPELQHGWKVLVDTELKQPKEGTLVAVYLRDEGGILGRWQIEEGRPILRKTNRQFMDIRLGEVDSWTLWRTVTKIVEVPVALDWR